MELKRMFNNSLVPFAIVACVLACFLPTSETTQPDTQKKYKLLGRPFEDKIDVVTQLRNFISPNRDESTRCHIYALALDKYQDSTVKFDYFDMVRLAEKDTTTLRKELEKVSHEEVAKLYNEVIKEFVRSNSVDQAMLELYDCLRPYEASDPDARRLFNNQNIKKVVSQYKSIVEQPAKMLEGEHKHPTLYLEDLHEAVANSVAKWLKGGKAELGKLFNSRPKWAAASTRATANQDYELDFDQTAYDYKPDETYHPVEYEGEQEPDYEPLSREEELNRVYELLGLAQANVVNQNLNQEQKCRMYLYVIYMYHNNNLDERHEQKSVESIVDHVLSTHDEPFEPDTDNGELFLSTLEMFDPTTSASGIGPWLEMADCATIWEGNEYVTENKNIQDILRLIDLKMEEASQTGRQKQPNEPDV